LASSVTYPYKNIHFIKSLIHIISLQFQNKLYYHNNSKYFFNISISNLIINLTKFV